MRPEKANIVTDLSEKLNRSPFLLVTDYQRMNVNHFGELRNRLAPMGAEVHVVKNSFLRRAITVGELPDITGEKRPPADLCQGPTPGPRGRFRRRRGSSKLVKWKSCSGSYVIF